MDKQDKQQQSTEKPAVEDSNNGQKLEIIVGLLKEIKQQMGNYDERLKNLETRSETGPEPEKRIRDVTEDNSSDLDEQPKKKGKVELFDAVQRYMFENSNRYTREKFRIADGPEMYMIYLKKEIDLLSKLGTVENEHLEWILVNTLDISSLRKVRDAFANNSTDFRFKSTDIEGKLREIKQSIFPTLREITERLRRQDKQKGYESFEKQLNKVTDLVNMLPRAVQEVYHEQLFRHVRESFHREYNKVLFELKSHAAAAMQQTSREDNGRLGIDPSETIVLMKDIRNTYVSNPKFQVMAIRGESQRRQNFSSATKPYGQKTRVCKDTKLFTIKSSFHDKYLWSDMKLVGIENSLSFMDTGAGVNLIKEVPRAIEVRNSRPISLELGNQDVTVLSKTCKIFSHKLKRPVLFYIEPKLPVKIIVGVDICKTKYNQV